jgi:hypothetical protein
MRSIIANLTPASGRQDHTTSPSAASSFVRTATRATTLPRPPHPKPYVRDDRETPSIGNGMARDKPVIWVKWKERYF